MKFGYKYRLLYGNCGPVSSYQRCDYIHQFSERIFEEARATVPASKMTLLPMGLSVSTFETSLSKQALREKYHVPVDRFVVLAVSSLDDRFKRLQWLIETIAEMKDPNLHFLLVGQNEQTPYACDTLKLANSLLAGQYQHLTVPHSKMAEVYKLSDVFVHPALQEGFGKVYLEAAACRIPVLCHDSAHTRWLILDDFSRLDMEDKTLLQSRINRIREDSPFLRPITERNYLHVVESFDWKNLRSRYLDMFQAALSPGP